MPFLKEEKEELLKVKYVGETVIKRFEQIGIDSLEKLSNSSVEEITDIVSDILESSCWKSSPQAKKAVSNAINFSIKKKINS